MTDRISELAVRFVKGNSVIAEARRLGNLLLNLTLGAYLYELFYGPYEWYSVTEYKKILSFFMDGEFIIPLCFFILAYGLTQLMSWLLFEGLLRLKVLRLKENLINYDASKEELFEARDISKRTSRYLLKEGVTKDDLKGTYANLVEDIQNVSYIEFEEDLKGGQIVLRYNFYFAVRMLVVLTVYFIKLADFSVYLYAIVSTLVLMSLFFFLVAYRFLDILPSIVLKYIEMAEIETTGYKMEHSKKAEN